MVIKVQLLIFLQIPFMYFVELYNLFCCFDILIWFHRYTLNEYLIVTTGLIEAACKRTVVSNNKGNANLTNGVHESDSTTSKAQNANGFKSSNGSANGASPNGNGV